MSAYLEIRDISSGKRNFFKEASYLTGYFTRTRARTDV